MANYSNIKKSQTIAESHHNSSGKKLEPRGMRKHKGDRKRDREDEERCKS